MLTPQVPEYIRSIIPYVPGKPIEETKREYKIRQVVKLASNENPLGPSPKACLALRKEIRELHRYPDGSTYRLKQALSTHLEVGPERLIIGNGSNEVIDMLVRTFCVPGDAIVTSRAAFLAYKLCAQIHGVLTQETPMTEDLRFNLPAMLQEVRKNERVRLVFIANPNNPTGTYVNRDEMRFFLREMSAIRGGSVLVVLDYAYWEYVSALDLPDPMVLLKDYPNLIVLRTFSKVYGLAGLRVGYGIGPDEVISSVEKIRQPFNINSLAQVAAVAALSDRAFVLKSKKMNAEGLRFWERSLSVLEIPFWKSQGNFLLANVGKGMGMKGGDVYLACLKQGVIFRPVSNYGLPDALRISVGTPAENKRAFQVLRDLKGSY